MQFQLPIHIKPPAAPILFGDRIMLIGSCFTEHMARQLRQHGFPVLENPNGILFNPQSVARSLNSYLRPATPELFCLHELWHSWDYHSLYSHQQKEKAQAGMERSQQTAGTFLKSAQWLIITLGSAYQYFLKENKQPVANNHRAPGQWFEKKLLEIDFIKNNLSDILQALMSENPALKIIFTISPVRHSRDGIVANNRSKARLLEAVHQLCEQSDSFYYFPAYELVIDVLRDYRFYDLDLVHPNFAATQFVWEQFQKHCIETKAHAPMQEIKEVFTGLQHRPRFPETEAHKRFESRLKEQQAALSERYPWLQWPVEN